MVHPDLRRNSAAGPAYIAAADAYGLLFEHVDNMVCTLDLEGRFTSVNRAGERLTGYREDELVGRLAVELIAPEFREEAVRQFQKRLDSGEHAADESELVTREGQRVPIEVASTLYLGDEKPAGVLGIIRDLTDRKNAADALRQSERAEEALRESEQRFRSSFESAPIGMALVAPDGRFLQVNASLCDLVGYPADELATKTFQQITQPDDLELDLEYVRQMLAGEIRTYHMEKRYIHKDGAIVWILLSVSLVRAGDGSPSYFIAQIEDITERKRAQEALERSEARLAEAQQVAHIGSWATEFGSGQITWSEELHRIYGSDPAAALTAERLLDRVHAEDAEAVADALARTRDTGEPFSVEFRVVHADGCLRWVHGRGEAVRGDDGPIGMRGTAQDITERKEAEQRYRTLVEQLPLGTYVSPLDMSQPNIFASPQVEPMLGYPASAWETDPGLLARIVHPDDRERVLGDANRVRKTGEPLRDEYRYVARDGRIVWVQDETYVVCDERGEPAFVQGFLLDITERKAAEAERDRLRDDLHHAQKLDAIGRLAGGVAHDFNNMLTAIKGYSELLLDQLDPGGPLHRQAAQIQRAADQAAALPKQLLAFGRKQALEPKVVDLNEIVSRASDLLRHLITEAVDLVALPAAAAASAFVDPSQVEHVLVNLALNASDAMPGGGTLTIATDNVEIGDEVAAEHGVVPGSFVVISVADTGEGMDAETKARAFEPFFTTRSQGTGYGLGLANVYGTVMQSGGFIALTTAPRRGATFEIHFPCAETAPEPIDVRESGRPKAERAATALVVEDADLVRELAVSVLERAGLEVHAATDGEEGLRLYNGRGGSFDVLVTDLVMPGLGGRELAQRVRESAPDLPIVFMSGYAEEGPSPDADAGPSATFLQKPFSARELVGAVTQVMRNGNGHGPASNGFALTPSDDVATLSPLTPRECEILGLVAEGMTNEKVAAVLAISPETVQSHIRNSMAKLDADSRTQAVATALRQSLIA